uniref:NADH-ubiquinone oxidoreductase chain 5 n=1 Tax=Diaphanosoma excisum TaxID=2094052 RepID=A0A8A1RXI7_9CRUS|nr:NADH dehydrogenase subunit 5 [Diaphanosoma excisum]QST19913.1 NADH dehydrogenase subunit 5 [Diaphanosoma excisum]
MNGSLVSLVLSFLMNLNEKSVFLEWSFGGGENNLTATFLFDQTSFLFLSIVLFISANVVFYSRSYMSEDPNADRFILLVFAFVISMIIMIISPNIISILLGWDGLGLVSYCLVIYYPTKKSSSAGMLTVLSNRVGDVCILLTIAWFSMVGDYNFLTWSFWFDHMSSNSLGYLIMFAAMTKSAQIPFSAWLPAAMAAPTPVSALVHSSTLVTAGVYLLIRFSGTLSFTDKSFLLFVATMTMFMSGLVANFEFDLKKIIALSTLSQLGMMMFSIALGLYELAFFHLVIHALFKALLFLCAGAAIHGVGGSQDIRVYGSLVKNFPLIGVCLNYANLSLCGFPFLAGFYSKDIIIEMAAQGFTNQMILVILFISVGLTVGYSVRLTYYTFVDFPNGGPSSFVCDQDYLMTYPILNLTIFSIISGAALSWVNFHFPYSIMLPLSLKLLTLVFIFLGGVLSLAVSFSFLPKKISFYFLHNFIGSLWFFPSLSGQYLSGPSLHLGGKILKYNDQAWIEEVLLGSVWNTSAVTVRKLEWLQFNELKLHLLLFILWLVLILMFLM